MIKKVYLFLLLLVSIYFVLGGVGNIVIDQMFEEARQLPENVTSDQSGGQYRNIEEQNASMEYDKMQEFFPIYEAAGSTISYIITLMSFGILGSIIRLLLATLVGKSKIEDQKVFTVTCLGAIIGLLMLVVGELLPDFKYQSGNNKFFYTMAVLSGIYTEEFFQWLEKKLKSFFSNN